MYVPTRDVGRRAHLTVYQLWPQVTAIILPSVINELNPPRAVYLTLAQNLGLAVGAAGWGVGSDIIGRRWAFNLTVRRIPPSIFFQS